MSFIDELNQANDKRKEVLTEEVNRTAAQILEYVKKQMMQRVNAGGGQIKELTERVQVRVSAMRGAEYEFNDSADDFDRAIHLFGDALFHDFVGTIKAAGKFGAGVFDVRSKEALCTVTETVRELAEEAGIQQISVNMNDAADSAVLTFTAHLNGGN